MNRYNYSDGLIYVNDSSGGYDRFQNRWHVSDSKQLWCFGNYSRFVRPGMKRIAASIEDITGDISAAGSLMISAYKDAVARKLVFVIVNMSSGSKTFGLSGLGSTIKIADNKLDAYTTTATKSLSRSVAAADNIKVEAKSVTTLVGTYY